ncbi:MAG: hypothetical protein M1830_009009 [Pleopsidium flavum]|nr:MAG: hypothetical protein M1830_009009 [Pleopsidium flavum]
MDSQTADTPPAQTGHILPKDEEKPSDSTSYELQMPEKGLEMVPDGAEPPQQEDEYVTGFKLALILISITVVYFVMMLDMSILATAIPYITDDFHSLLDVGWYASAYQLACASLQPLTGKIYSRLSSKWSFLAFFFVFEVGSLVCGAATSSPMLIVGRAVAGLGGSGLMNGGLTILNSCVPPHRQPALLGIMMAIGYLGIAVGPLIGGALTEYVSWRWCFYINLPVGGSVALFLLLLPIPDQVAKPGWRTVLRKPLSEFDLIGFALFAPASVQVFLALQYGGNQYAWNSAMVIGLFCGAGATFLLFLVWDYRQGDAAMIPLSMVRKRAVWSSCLTALFLAGSIFITGYYLPIYFQAVLGASPLMSGVYVLPNILTQTLITVVVGGLVEKFGYYLPFMLFCGVLNAIASGLLTLLSPTSSTGQWVVRTISEPPINVSPPQPILAIQNTLSRSQIPVAMSSFVFCQYFGGAIMVVLAQTIFTNSLRETVPKYAPSVNAETVIAAGSTRMRQIVPSSEITGVLLAYSTSIDRIFYLCASIAVVSFFFSCFMGWQDIRKKGAKTDRQV